MLEIKTFTSLDSLKKATALLKNDGYYFLGEFLREIDKDNDELIIILNLDNKDILIKCIHSNKKEIPKISDIYYSAYLFENEIYDYFGKTTENSTNYILRLHNYPKNYFPKRKLGKPIIKNKNEYIFTNIKAEGTVKVQVGPIHAGIIPPAHFRFTCDGEDTINLDIQNGWIHRGIENYFEEEVDLEKLLIASEEIVGDSKISHSLSFVKIIEKSSNIQISESTKLNRVILIELERIYNHLWTMGAILNDVGQSYLLNGFLEIREELLNLNEKVFGNRLLGSILNFGKNNIYINKDKSKEISKIINKIKNRYKNLLKISISSAGIYDRLYTTGIVKQETALEYSALGVSAKSSGLKIDGRINDNYYKDFNINIPIGENGDCFDRFNIRAEEVFESFKIINQSLDILKKLGFENDNNIDINLKDGFYIGKTEGHRGENIHLGYIKNGKIIYYKIKDPSFINWSLLEYAVLNNIIADFPICNKSFDLSYSGFDL